MNDSENKILETADRDEWFIAPAWPSEDAPREWRQSEENAIIDAQKFATKHGCLYEVYKRVGLIRPNIF